MSAIQAELHDFRQATNASFNALRQDFVDLRAHVDQGFTQLNQAFTEVRGRLDGSAAGQQRIADLIQTLIDQQ